MQKMLIIGNHFAYVVLHNAKTLVKSISKLLYLKLFLKVPIVIFRNISNFATY